LLHIDYISSKQLSKNKLQAALSYDSRVLLLCLLRYN